MKQLALGAATITLLLVGQFPNVTDARAALSTSLAPQNPPPCAGFCTQCDWIETKYEVQETDWIPNDEDEEVACGHHTACQQECRVSLRQDLSRVIHVVALGNDEELHRALREVRGLRVNVKRQALQLEGCLPGSIILHLPLTVRQTAVAGAHARLQTALHE